jgi:hypothetical protein
LLPKHRPNRPTPSREGEIAGDHAGRWLRPHRQGSTIPAHDTGPLAASSLNSLRRFFTACSQRLVHRAGFLTVSARPLRPLPPSRAGAAFGGPGADCEAGRHPGIDGDLATVPGKEAHRHPPPRCFPAPRCPQRQGLHGAGSVRCFPEKRTAPGHRRGRRRSLGVGRT